MGSILGLFLALLQFSMNVVANEGANPAKVEPPCRARAWVRAPDLVPGQVIQGDVKVKLEGACEDVLSYTLRLRFAERAWVKARREGVQLPENPVKRGHSSSYNTSIFQVGSRSMLWNPYSDVTSLALAQYETDMQNPDLWLIREEERIGFEVKYDLGDGKTLGKDVVESFGILVPTTNYPPAFNPVWSVSGHRIADTSGAEHMYSYLVDISFLNGTVLEVPAGYTSFNAQTDAVVTGDPETFNVTLKEMSPSNNDTDVDVFSLEVTFPQGRHLEQGSKHNVTIVSHRAGPGRDRPEGINLLHVAVSPKHHWAASFAADNEAAENILNSGRCYPLQMTPTNPMPYSDSPNLYDELTRPKFSQDGAVMNGSTLRTEPVTAMFDVSDDCYPSFEMQYQTIEVELSISLNVQPTTDLATDEPEDEEYDWIPTLKQPRYSGRHLLPAKIPLVIIPNHKDSTKLPPADIVHYLSPEARVPVFVDPKSVKDLQQKSINERNALAPKAQPTVIAHDGVDIIEDKYAARRGPDSVGMRYVGDTWYRKVVLPRNKQEMAELRVQS